MIGSSLQPYIYSLNIFILCMSALGLLRMFITFWFANVYDYQFIKYRYAHHRRIKRFSPSISVIVPAFNEEKAIIQTLASICRSTYKKISIVVVDDGSSDNTAILVKEFIEVHPDNDIKLIQQPNSGKSVAINNALFNYDNSVLTMVLDADSLLKEDAIEKMVKWFLNPKIVALAMNVKMLTLPTFIGACQRFEFISAYRGKCAEHVLKTLYIIGGIGSTFRTDKLKNIGGYDTNTPTEDIDLTLKLLSRYGNKDSIIGYANDAVAYTQPVKKFKSLIKQRYRWKYGRFIAFVKYHNLFFNMDKKFSKMLTFFQLPLAVFQELFMLVEPFVYLYLLFVTIYFQDLGMFIAMVSYVFVVISLSVTASRESLKSKLLLLCTAPFNFFLSYILTIVEYVSLINSILHLHSIVDYNNNHANWSHVERL